MEETDTPSVPASGIGTDSANNNVVARVVREDDRPDQIAVFLETERLKAAAPRIVRVLRVLLFGPLGNPMLVIRYDLDH